LKGAPARQAWVALAALNALRPPFGTVGDEWPDSFEHAYIPGRFDVRGRGFSMWRTNPDGARVLADTLREHDPRTRGAPWWACWRQGLLGMIDCLAPEVDSFVFTVPTLLPNRGAGTSADWSGSSGVSRWRTRSSRKFERAWSGVQA